MVVRTIVIAVLLAAVVAGGAGGASAPGRLSGASELPICAAAGPYFPSMTLALTSGTAWVACKAERRVVRVRLPAGTRRSIAVPGGELIAVLAAFGSVWTLDEHATLTRIRPASNRLAQARLGLVRPYNLWAGAGSLWTVDDASGEVVRIAPATSKVTARIAVGDGPSDLAFAGGDVWVVNHRDRRLVRIDAATNRAATVAVLPGDAPERIVALGSFLWLTGRGTDLLQVDPADGRVVRVVEIGASGIDVVAGAGALWIPVRTAAAERRGFPTLEALRRVTPSTGSVRTVARAHGRVDVHGLAATPDAVWLADNTAGTLYRVPG